MKKQLLSLIVAGLTMATACAQTNLRFANTLSATDNNHFKTISKVRHLPFLKKFKPTQRHHPPL